MEWIILAGVGLDIVLGDPRWMPHPVVAIGRLVQKGEKLIHRLAKSSRGLRLGGLLLSLVIVLGCYGFFWALLKGAFYINNYLGWALSILIMSQALAINSLYKHARSVSIPLKQGQLEEARAALSMIVGRDTAGLDEKEIVRGTVETVAENTVDGIIAPLFYGFIGGPPLAMAYKAVNTLDSMIGYKNEKYLYLGWAGARLDDLANFIPARLSALLFLLLAPFTPGGVSGVWLTVWRDSSRHPSPNSGIPEAATAGALRVQLGGCNYYGGVRSERPLIGQPLIILRQQHIGQSLFLMIAVSMLGTALGVLIYRLLESRCIIT
ncbi:MAG: adenosylcobinamide-phosphate synthase CbiB [Syntrophomonas sp.]